MKPDCLGCDLRAGRVVRNGLGGEGGRGGETNPGEAWKPFQGMVPLLLVR